jgi:hypothetical protein
MLWSGDAAPQAQALRIAENAGLLNMNGGNTIITRSFPSLTAVSPLGYALDGIFQTLRPGDERERLHQSLARPVLRLRAGHRDFPDDRIAAPTEADRYLLSHLLGQQAGVAECAVQGLRLVAGTVAPT